MRPDDFIRNRQPDWQALSDLLDATGSTNHRLTPAQIDRLGRLYRSATADLALAQRDFPRHELTRYLNQLAARGHAIIYGGRPVAWGRLRTFITTGFPRAYRQNWPFTLVAGLLFFLPALLSGWVVAAHPPAAVWLLPDEIRRLEETLVQRELWIDIPIEDRPYVSSFIMRNNIQVMMVAFGLGVLGGIFTLWVLVLNGLVLGGVSGLTAFHGLGMELWNFVIGHGVIELSVIVMAGGAGLSLGWAVLRPGLLRRRDALTIAARRSVRLVVGAVPLLVAAGLIEGFISPSETIPAWMKWGLGLGSGVVLYAYWLLGGREKPAAPRRIWRKIG